MNPLVWQEIQAYVRFDSCDETALRDLYNQCADKLDLVTTRFYERLQEHPQAFAVLTSQASIDRLRAGLATWLDTLLTGPWNEEYFASRVKIGQVHVKVRLPQRYMMTSMSVIRQELDALVNAYMPNDTSRVTCQRALDKILDIELAIMLESYQEDRLMQVRTAEALNHELLARRLAISEARYAAVIESAGAAVFALDRAQQIVLVNVESERVSEYPRSQLLKREFFEFLCHPDDREALREFTDTALSRSEERAPFSECMSRLLSASGKEHWIRWHATRLATLGEPVACLFGFDVTEEHRLQDRTKQVETMANLGTLAAGLAHEIRNPLNAAKLQLLLVERRLERLPDEDRSKARGAARTVREEIDRLSELVGDFLSFARPGDLRLSGGDLRVVVADVVDLLLREAEKVPADLKLRKGTAVFARFDKERIKQVLHNLIRNALEAAGSNGDVTIVVERKGKIAIMEVSDSGGGVTSELDAFEPFSTTKPAGTGLGLSIAKRIVQDHHGKISYFRTEARTVFRVELPVDGV